MRELDCTPRPAFDSASFFAALALAVALAPAAAARSAYDKPPTSFDPNSPKLFANNVAFDSADVDVPAGAPFILVFENGESVGHNVSVYSDTTYQTRLFEGAVFSGPATRWYPMPSLGAGTWVFRCDLHPDMNGRLHA